jgi:hypothetical protein
MEIKRMKVNPYFLGSIFFQESYLLEQFMKGFHFHYLERKYQVSAG